ncbi:SWIRM domain-domain-containing protein [Syncephalastrum racemosum]|uniref:SWIRM domain-domain-containing protein n=1 Tax=Syncephalastrum racemosum TaxID=13706 RepID=A0A1X2H9E2_SYNRA|nr:SWIRM domain-domain-containing protein [Syncephalastrum racemosum]
MQIDEPTPPGLSGTHATSTPDPSLLDGPPLPLLNPLYQPGVRIRDLERERPQLGGRQRKNEFEPYSNGDITNISLFTEPYICFPPEDVTMKLENESDVDDVNAFAKASPYNYKEPPKFPEWFDMETVHELEKFALPEFFESDMNEAAADYKRCRDYMISAYRARPDYYLTIIACKNALNEDLVSLTRIHSFLEQAQLINSEVDPRRKIFDPYVDCDPDAGVQKIGSQRDFVNIGQVDIQYLRDLIYSTAGLEKERSQWNIRVEDDTNPDARKTYLCSSCNRDCSEVRYQSLKYKTVQLCADCFLDGKFTSNTWSGEFLRVEKNPEDDTEDDWTDSETLRLLEGVDQFDDDWLAISEHVGTRSKEQCITQFLQLPIDDTFLSARLNQQEHDQVPFADQANPVMTMIAFLSGHINPGVGSIAAKAALKSLVQSSKDSSSTSSNNKDGEDDAMQIDDEGAFTPEQMRDATRAALTSAVEQARQLAAYENEEVQHWTRLAAKTVVDKLTLKMQQYAELEQSLESEMAEIEKQSVSLQSSIEAFMKQYPPSTSTPTLETNITSAPSLPPTNPSTSGPPPPPASASTSSPHVSP